MKLGDALVDSVFDSAAFDPGAVKSQPTARAASHPASPEKRIKHRTPRGLQFETLEIRQVLTGSGILSAVTPTWFQSVSSVNHATVGSVGSPSAAGQFGEASIGTGGAADSYDWIVNFKASAVAGITSLGQLSSLFDTGVEVEVVRGLGLVGQVLVRTHNADIASVEEWFRGQSIIAGFEQDILRSVQATPNDASYGSQYALNNTGQSAGTVDADIDAPEAWNITTGSSSIVVGVIDTGIDYNHPDLAANIWTNPGEIAGNGLDDDGNGFVDDVHGYDFVNYDSDPMDDNNHGTHVAGTIGAVGNNGVGVTGVAWNVKMMALKFLGASGSGFTSDAVQAINYATMMRTTYGVNIRVLSNSWGSGSYSYSLDAAVNASNTAGMLFVAAAGNETANNDVTPHYPSNLTGANVIAVAATDRKDAIATYSNYGATTVDLAAPGTSIYSTLRNGGYGSMSGTSMATPHVSGAAVLAWAYNPNLTVAQVKAAILGSVDVISSLSGKVVTGGRLNANKMLLALQASSNPNFTINGSTLTVAGTSSNDAFEFVHGNGGQHTVIFNGQSSNVDPSLITTIRFEGGGGTDSAIVRGSNGADTAVINVGGGTVSGAGYSVVLVSIESIDLYGGAGDTATLNDSSGNDTLTALYNLVTLSGSGYSNKARSFATVYVVATTGTDSATFTDSSGNDTFVAQSDLSYMYGTGYLNHVRNFDAVVANSTTGGIDIAYMYDSTGNDTFTGRATQASFVGTGFSNTVNSFDNVYADANRGGTDTANLYDSAGSDTFVFTPVHAYIVSPGAQFNLAEHFDNVYAYAQNGGVDTAHLFDSTGNDTFNAYETYATLTGTGFYGNANGWDLVYGRSEAGGTDTANLYDTASSDAFVATGDYAYIAWSSYLNFANDFEVVRSVSGNGGNDFAYFFDSAGNDTFTGRSDYTQMTGAGFDNRATGYKNVYVRATAGGNDTATLYDSTGDDTFVATVDSAYVHNTVYHQEVRGFDSVYSIADRGGHDEAYLFDTAGSDLFESHSDYSFLQGSGLLFHARGYDYVYSESTHGGSDTARFYDSTGIDNFTSGAGYAYMTGTGYTNNTQGYATVRADSTAGGNDQAFLNDSAGNDSLNSSGSTATLTNSSGVTSTVGFKKVKAMGTNGGVNTATQGAFDFVLEKTGSWN